MNIEFVMGQSRMRRHSAIWIIVDRLIKSVKFMAIRAKLTLESLIGLHIAEVVSFHGVPKAVISYRDSRFTSNFRHTLHKCFRYQDQDEFNISSVH